MSTRQTPFTNHMLSWLRWPGSLCLLCIFCVACIADDPPLDGWGCINTSDCGSAKDYICHIGLCMQRCDAQGACPASYQCQTTKTYKVCIQTQPTDGGETPEGNEPQVREKGETDNDDLPEQGTELDARQPDDKTCVPNTSRSCFLGPPGTANVGQCKSGAQKCTSNGLWGPCEGSITPSQEVCNGQDNDCDGNIDNVQGTSKPLTKACYSGPSGTKNVGICKGGTQQCLNGTWERKCKNQILPRPTDLCQGKDDNCDGNIDGGCPCKNGQSRSCGSAKGNCQQGIQECTEGVWGVCKGDIQPSQELCDNEDNDCDGQTDEDFNLGVQCTVGQGECRNVGVRKCASASSTTCSASPKNPKAEICDGKDNNCNGQIDEQKEDGACNTGQQGECKAGINECQNGMLKCAQQYQATTERCRNGKDEDCDGKIDELCGPQYPHALVFANQSNIVIPVRTGTGKPVSNQLNSAQRKGAGKYELQFNNTSCATSPLFLTPHSHYKHALAYRCKIGGTFEIHSSERIINNISTSKLPNGDANFFAMAPNQQHDHWFVLNTITCTGQSCGSYNKRGTIAVRRTAKGVYEVKSARCRKLSSPIFTTIYAGSPAGWATAISKGNGICEVRTFDTKSTPSDSLNVAIWLPDPTKVAWAMMTINGPMATINDSNTFGEPGVRWSGTRVSSKSSTCPPNFTGTCNRTQVLFPAWHNPSVILLQSLIPISNQATLLTSSAISSSTGTAHISSFQSNSPGVLERRFLIVFVQ